MTKDSLAAAMLLGLVTNVAVVSTAVAQTRPQPGVPARSTVPDIPRVSPESTAAKPAIVIAQPSSDERRPVPTYTPDGGGALSGLPYDRGATVAPAEAPIGTLAEAITLAYRTNPDLLAARGQARAADYRIPQARSAYGPTLSATGAYTFTRYRQELLTGAFGGAQGWTSTASLILNQPLFTFGRNAAAEASAYATSAYQRDLLRVNEAQVLSNVVTAYVAVLRDAALVTIARENLALLQRQLSDNSRRYEARDLTATDLEQTRTRLEAGSAQLLEVQGRLGVSQNQFLEFVGAPPGELAQPDLLDIRFGSLAGAYAYAETNSGLIRAAQTREKISRAAIESAKAEMRPRIDGRGTADYGSLSPYTDQLRTTQLIGQVVLTQPLIDSGLRRGRLNEAREANQADWRLIDSALRETRSTIGSAWDQLAASRSSLVRYRAAIEAAERAYQGALIQQRAGDRSTLDVLDLARDLLTVRNSYFVAVANEYNARVALFAAAGMLEGPMIVPGLAPYDTDEQVERVRRKADISLITPALAGLDGVINGDTRGDRMSRDAGARQANDESVPLPPAP